MSKYVVTKTVADLDGVGTQDLLVRVVFKDRLSAVSYVRMYIEKRKYRIALGEYNFPVTGNIIVDYTENNKLMTEEYQLVELIDENSSEYSEVMKEIEDWTLSLRTLKS